MDLIEENEAGSNAELISGEVTIPLIEEQLVISKRLVETGKVRLTKHAEERLETIEVPLTEIQWRVEHVPIDRVVDQVPAVRVEGDTTVYPVVEERLVVLRELVLREEVHITRTAVTKIEQSSHTVRREVIVEQRLGVTDATLSTK